MKNKYTPRKPFANRGEAENLSSNGKTSGHLAYA